MGEIFLDVDKQSINSEVPKNSACKIQCTSQKRSIVTKKQQKISIKHAVWVQFQFSWQNLCKTSQ